MSSQKKSFNEERVLLVGTGSDLKMKYKRKCEDKKK